MVVEQGAFEAPLGAGDKAVRSAGRTEYTRWDKESKDDVWAVDCWAWIGGCLACLSVTLCRTVGIIHMFACGGLDG